jgi:hypothetical protein
MDWDNAEVERFGPVYHTSASEPPDWPVTAVKLFVSRAKHDTYYSMQSRRIQSDP